MADFVRYYVGDVVQMKKPIPVAATSGKYCASASILSSAVPVAVTGS